MNAKEIIGYALAGYSTAEEIKKLKDNDITAEEAKELKAAGYKKADVFKLLDMVEPSTNVEEAAPEHLEKLNNTPDPTPAPAPAEEKVDDIETLAKLLQEG